MRAIIVVGMGLGDEGKGSMVDYLVRKHQASTVVRFNGGAQAAHSVVLPDGRSHVFSQFGSGTFVPGVRTYLSRFHMLNPRALFNESLGLKSVGIHDAISRLYISSEAPVTTPFHIAANRIITRSQGSSRHGTTGMGIGETAKDVISGVHLQAHEMGSSRLFAKLRAVQERKRAECIGVQDGSEDWRVLNDLEYLRDVVSFYRDTHGLLNIVSDYRLDGTVVFEGAQGALLDETHGLAPHTTWSNTTPANARTIINEHGCDDVLAIGVMRAYATRHGEGPMVTEAPMSYLHEAEVDSRWAGGFRVGYTDLVMARHAARVSKVDALAVTCMDRILYPWQVCTGYRWEWAARFSWNGSILIENLHPDHTASVLEYCTPVYETVDETDLPSVIADSMSLPLCTISYGPTHKDKKET